MKKTLLFLGLLLIAFVVTAQTDKVVEKIINDGLNDNRTMEHLDIFSNRIGGRVIGSDAYASAEIWAARKFIEWGLEVELDEVGTLPVGFNRGYWSGKMLSEDGMILHFATPSYTSGTKGVQRGRVLIAPTTQAQFDRMKEKLKGAWVLISGKSHGSPIDFSKAADEKRANIITENLEIAKRNKEVRANNRKYKDKPKKQQEETPLIEAPALFYSQMVEAGILGVIQSAPVPIVALSDRKNIYSMNFDSLPSVPDIKLDEHQYAIIKQMTKERRYFELEFDIRNHFRPGPIAYHNVVGMIRGSEFPDEYVIVSGHLDAYDVATGAVDDGSGISVTMETARLLAEAGAKPKRSILFILFAGEEFGLLGSKSWIEKNPEKLENISNMFNRDGGPSAAVGMRVSAAMREDMEKVCQPLFDANLEIPFELKHRETNNRPKRPWGTDSGPFAVEGVPTIYFDSGYPDGDNFSYREIWHTERDTYDKSIAKYQEQAAMITAVVVYGIANLDHQLSRDGYYFEEKDSSKNEKK